MVAWHNDCDVAELTRTTRGKGGKNVGRWMAMGLCQDYAIRAEAVSQYANTINSEEDIDTLAANMEDPDTSVQLASVEALHNVPVYEEGAEKALIDAAQSPYLTEFVQLAALRTLNESALKENGLDTKELAALPNEMML